MSNKLYVGNLPFTATEHELTDLFSPFGAVADVKLILDHATGRSRGFAFVTMSTDDEAEGAARGLHGKPYQGRNLTVNEARPQSNRSGGGGGGGGNFRGGPRSDSAPRGEGGYRGGGGGGGSHRGGGGGGKFQRDRKPFSDRRGGGHERRHDD